MINKLLLSFALLEVFRQKAKSIFIFFTFSFLIFILSSFLIFSDSLSKASNDAISFMPDLIIQDTRAGKIVDISTSVVDKLLQINAVSLAFLRVWGLYEIQNATKNGKFFVIGVDEFEPNYKPSLEKIANKTPKLFDENQAFLLAGSGALNIMKANYFNTFFNFIRPDGRIKSVKILGEIDKSLGLFSDDLVIVSSQTARDIFGIKEDFVSDIGLNISKNEEINIIKLKIKEILPNAKIISKQDKFLEFKSVFGKKSGAFLMLFFVVLLIFAMIIFDNIRSVLTKEKKEIAMLKILGFSVNHLLKKAFWQSFFLSFFSLVFGVFLGFVFVYYFNAPILRDIFLNLDSLPNSIVLPFVFNFKTMFLIFFITTPVYVGTNLIAYFLVASDDSFESLR